MKIRRTRKQSAPRNLAARALRSALYRPRVTRNPKAYRRKGRHKSGPDVAGPDPHEE